VVVPVWLPNEGAGIALGISAPFVVAGVVMHRVIAKVLQAGPAAEENRSHE
jgi:hypothetical protein